MPYEGKVDDEVFIIDSKDALIAFAANPTKSARVTAAIDLTGETWTSIEGFAHTFDGGNCEIKGLTAPLFGATSGSFVNVKLVDVNITETVNPNVAALARNIIATETEAPAVTNCSASGKITVNCAEYVPNEDTTHTNCAVGGLVGHSAGVSYTNCVNGVAIDIKQVVKSGNTVSNVICIGGISGFVWAYKRADATILLASAENCENTANITVLDKSYTGENSAEGAGSFAKTSIWVGGIFGSDYNTTTVQNVGAVAKNLTNRGNISVEAYAYDLFVAGIISNSYAIARDNLVNYGKLSVINSETGRTFIGGICGCIQASVLANSENHGEIYTANSSARSVYFGGVLGYNKAKINSCENSGVLNIDYNTYSRTEAYEDVKDYGIGGVVGSTATGEALEVHDCTNKGAVNVAGTICNVNGKTGYQGIGGVVGILRCVILRSTNEAAVTIKANTTNVSTNANVAYLHIGGAVGSCLVANYNDETISNSGDVLVESGTHDNFLDVAGLVGYAAKRVGGVSTTHCVNTGNVTLGKEGETLTCNKSIYVAGGSAHPLTWVVDIDNYGTVSIAKGATIGNYCYMGGVCGRAYFTDANVTRCNNYGAVESAGTHNGRAIFGGLAGEVRNSASNTGLNITDCTNSGNITIKEGFAANHTESTTIGGIAGVWASKNAGLKRSTNSGTITIENGATFTPETRIAGICATPDMGNLEQLTNDGALVLRGTHASRLCAGGIVGYCTSPIPSNATGGTNNGTITFAEGGKCKELELGGICGLTKQALRNSVNNGAINVAGEITGTITRVAGGIGWIVEGGMNTITNKGDVTIKSTAKMSTALGQIAGVVGISQGSNSHAFNTGTITIEEGVTFANGTMVAGCIADCRTNTTDAINTGNININSEIVKDNGWFVGGVFGKAAAKSYKEIQCYCTIIPREAQNVGFLMGSARSTTVYVTGGAVGGVLGKYNPEDETTTETALAEDNYVNYIYGAQELTDWAGTSDHDAVTFLSAAPTIE